MIVQIIADGGYGPGSGRFGAILAALVALIGLGIGAWSAGSIHRPHRYGNPRRGAVLALIVAVAGAALSGWHIARSAEGFGTGNGRAGAIVALVLALVGMVLGGWALLFAHATAPKQSPRAPKGCHPTPSDQHTRYSDTGT